MPKVKPIPDGFRTATPHLVTRNAAQAIDFYKTAFGAIERYRMPGPGGSTMHAEIMIGDSIIMLGEESPMCPENKCPASLGGVSTTISIYSADCDKMFERAVKAGAKPIMPVQEMFWGDRYGVVEDPSGHRWAVMTHVKDMTPDEMMKAGEEFFSSMAGQEMMAAKAKGSKAKMAASQPPSAKSASSKQPAPKASAAKSAPSKPMASSKPAVAKKK